MKSSPSPKLRILADADAAIAAAKTSILADARAAIAAAETSILADARAAIASAATARDAAIAAAETSSPGRCHRHALRMIVHHRRRNFHPGRCRCCHRR